MTMLTHTMRTMMIAAALATTALVPAAPQLIGLSGGAALAADTASAQKFLTGMADEAFAVLRNKSLSQSDREAQFSALLKQGFDVRSIGRRVLAKYGRVATPAQLNSYDSIFPDYMVSVYAKRLMDYTDASVRVLGTQDAGQGAVVVRTMVEGPSVAQPVRADWLIRPDRAGNLKVIDLYIEGVSMVITQQSDFGSRLGQAASPNAGIDRLIADMKASVSG